MRRRLLRMCAGAGVVGVVMAPRPALADNCGSLTDCFNTLSTALWVIAAVALIAAAILAFPWVVGGMGLGGGVAAGTVGGATTVVGGAVALPAAVAAALQISVEAAAAAALTDLVLMAKSNRPSGKERGSDIPNWARGERPQPGETPRQAAERLLDTKYGPGNWRQGPGSEFNKIKKFFERLRRRGS